MMVNEEMHPGLVDVSTFSSIPEAAGSTQGTWDGTGSEPGRKNHKFVSGKGMPHFNFLRYTEHKKVIIYIVIHNN